MILSFLNVAHSDDSCAVLFPKEEVVVSNQYIALNGFNTGRNIQEYWRNFTFSQAPSLKTITQNLQNGSIWIDMGAGNAIALQQGLLLNSNIQGVAIGFAKPQGYSEHPALTSRYSYLDGDFVENSYASGKLNDLKNKTDLITDYYGPISYSENLPPLFQIYFNLLKQNGVLIFHFESTKIGSENFFRANTIRVQDQLVEEGIINWLKSIPGVEVLEVVRDPIRSAQVRYAIQVKKVNPHILVPNTLITKKYLSDTPPIREFDLVAQ